MDDFYVSFDDIERDVYGDEGYEERHKPHICVFVREDGRYLYSRVAAPAEIANVEYEGEIYKVVREELVSGDFMEGRRSIKALVRNLQAAGVCPEEIRSILCELTERKNKDGIPRKDNKSHVAYKQPVARKEGIIAYVIE